ncbi:MAG TPA: ABC transporter transmembrane domain-containing protein, partial [Verrucomicrobiae bacterium]|nr:ABC transporter transmembrane domain-containing protein [Verrucomicrobiae bacterium]
SQTSTGQLISRVMNDTQQLQNILSGATSVIVRDPITVIFVLASLLFFSPQPGLTLIAIVALPAAFVPIAIYTRKVRRASREMQAQFAELTQTMTEAFTGHRVVKAYNLENIVAGEFRDITRKVVGNYMRIVRANEIPGALIEFFGACGLALLLAYLIYVAHARPNPTAFVQLVFSVVLIYQPIKNLTRLQNQIVQARAASERAFALLATQSPIAEPSQPKMLKAAGANIQFEHVHFSYGEKIAMN